MSVRERAAAVPPCLLSVLREENGLRLFSSLRHRFILFFNYNTFKSRNSFREVTLVCIMGRKWASPIFFLQTPFDPLKSVIIEEENGRSGGAAARSFVCITGRKWTN